MAQFVDGNVKTFEADGAIAQFARVQLDADGKVTTAGLTAKDIGTAEREAFAAGDKIPVRLRTASGTHKVIASEAVAVGGTLHTQASGKVGDTATATGYEYGMAIEASSADGDIIEAIRINHGDTANS
tara:strand:+ start:3203 stop:3586 length:384 start_codon:yes stop_codon:yes gene_type:complete